MDYILKLVTKVFGWLAEFLEPEVPLYEEPMPTPSELFYLKAIEFIGKDAEPDDIVNNRFACMIVVNNIYKATFGNYITKENHASTYWGYKALKDSPTFTEVTEEEATAGDIAIAPTGYGGKNGVTNGHIGIVSNDGIICSNSSLPPTVGLFVPNYTKESFRKYYGEKGGYLIKYYRINV